MLAGACSTSAQSAGPPATVSTNRIAAKPVGGSSGLGPVVVPDRTGGQDRVQEVVLPDRTLTVIGASRRRGANEQVAAIHVNIVIRNSGAIPIRNERSFFELTGSEGDVFGSLGGGADAFDGAIGPHGSRRGTLSFTIPAAAASGLRLLYRPEVATDSAIVSLRVG